MTPEPGKLAPESGEFDDYWAEMLTGDPDSLPGLSSLFRRMPAAPRCKACGAPFAGPYAPILRVLKFRPWRLNQQLCQWCFEGIDKKRGGAEVPVSLLFTDVRGSTSLAERMSASNFRSVMDRFYKVVYGAVDAHNGVVDHLAGDGVMALWTPRFGGHDHSERAVAAGRKLVVDMASDEALGTSLPVGVGVHTGTAWVGVVGESGAHDFTVLGDAPNTVARLGSAAESGELMMSEAIAKAAAIDTGHMERRLLDLRGKAEPYPAWIETRVA